MKGCDCDLCKREAEWEAVNNACYRCVHSLPCEIALENDRPCCTVLDVLANEL